MMREIKFLRRLPLCAAATAISALGLFGAAPAQAMPDFPLAPGDCPQWGFNGTTSFKQATGEDLVFESANQVAGGPSTWFYPNGSRDTAVSPAPSTPTVRSTSPGMTPIPGSTSWARSVPTGSRAAPGQAVTLPSRGIARLRCNVCKTYARQGNQRRQSRAVAFPTHSI